MLPTLVITLREGVEAALIVGIIAAFLVREGRRDALRAMWLGVGLAVALCLAVAVVLRVVGESLPQRQQEGLETVVGLIAVGMVTYMIVWMRRHSRALKGALQDSAAGALASGSTLALVGMAFLAVLREGLETAVFLLAVFQDSAEPAAAGGGAVLGLALAVAIGWGLYRGGVRINLSRFFRLTGVVLAFVAAGLLATAVHTAHEAGWFNVLQGRAVDLTWLVHQGTVTGSLLTGMLGLQPLPTVGETLAYLLFAVPVALFVVWPHGRRPGPRARRGLVTAALAALAALVAGGCGGAGGDGAKADGARTVKVSLADDGCSPQDLELPAGPTTFEVTGGGSGRTTEFEVFDGSRILGEVENVTPGLKRSFSITLEAGDYVLSCTGGSQEPTGRLAVTSEGASAQTADAGAAKAVDTYRTYLRRQSAALVTATTAFADAVRAGDVAGAKALYGPARIPYERIEPVAESFGGLDPAIDARAGDVPKAQWTGFHVLERALWVENSVEGRAPVAKRLLADVERLQRLVRTVELEPAQVANGAVELLGEVSRSKVTGEEERYSRLDLVDFKANVEGAQAAYDAVAPLLPDTAGGEQIVARFEAVDRALARHRAGDGFVAYDELTRQDTRGLSQAIDALAEPLSQVPAKIVA